MLPSKKIAEILDADLYGSDTAVFTGCTIDSRQVTQGNMFVAILGEKADGHSFIDKAFSAGADIVIGERTRLIEEDLRIPSGKALLAVDHSVQAMQKLAKNWCALLSIPVVGITGSNGKTTTKDMVAAVLATKYKIHKNKENYNNEIGVPLTILNSPSDTEILVLEMGMRGLGQIRELTEICRPSVGVITNIGTAHIELLGSRENIAKAKWELVDSLGKSGTAILNSEDFFSSKLAQRTDCPKIFYGIEGKYTEPDVKGSSLSVSGKLGTKFVVDHQGNQEAVDLPLPGEHNVLDALAAIAVGIYFDISLQMAAESLEGLTLSRMRLDISDGILGSVIIDDTYNANPDSMKASLAILAQRGGEKTVAVLGEMYELGDSAASGHREVGEEAARLKINRLVTVGDLAQGIARGAGDAGLPEDRIDVCSDCEQATEKVREIIEELGADTWVLIKGSRGMKMEVITKKLLS